MENNLNFNIPSSYVREAVQNAKARNSIDVLLPLIWEWSAAFYVPARSSRTKYMRTLSGSFHAIIYCTSTRLHHISPALLVFNAEGWRSGRLSSTQNVKLWLKTFGFQTPMENPRKALKVSQTSKVQNPLEPLSHQPPVPSHRCASLRETCVWYPDTSVPSCAIHYRFTSFYMFLCLFQSSIAELKSVLSASLFPVMTVTPQHGRQLHCRPSCTFNRSKGKLQGLWEWPSGKASNINSTLQILRDSFILEAIEVTQLHIAQYSYFRGKEKNLKGAHQSMATASS